MENLGFTMNQEKSDIITKNRQKFLGVVFETLKMSIHLTQGRKNKIRRFVCRVIHRQVKVRQAMGLIGLFSAAATAIGPVEIKSRELQLDVKNALKKHNFSYSAPCPLSALIMSDMKYWDTQINYLNSSALMLKPSNPNTAVSATTDDSGTCWGITSNVIYLAKVWSKKTQTELSN
ncbi:hypothetical protein AYI70_g1495 [Smittium culicis]|uniref:Reverse transcriptase domain-containing protein n=1 Tax=Smittium culicis TaxID=133412 RepID=A0A1R1YCE8_9FUNG|nr:hypothetical protein AYI70_g1495 [Smittium culicis]